MVTVIVGLGRAKVHEYRVVVLYRSELFLAMLNLGVSFVSGSIHGCVMLIALLLIEYLLFNKLWCFDSFRGSKRAIRNLNTILYFWLFYFNLLLN